MKRYGILLVGAALLLSSACGVGGSSETEGPGGSRTVRIGTLAAIANGTFMIEPKLGTLKEKGVSNKITVFTDGPTAMEGLASGQLDVVFAAIGPAVTWKDRGVDLKVVAGSGNGGQALFCRKGAVKSIADLKGKTVVSVSPGSVTDITFRKVVLSSAGLQPDAVNIVVAQGYAESANSVFVSQEAPCAMSAEPGPAVAEVAYGDQAEIFFDVAEHWREKYGQSYPATLMLASQEFIDEHPDLLRKVIEAHAEITDFINEQPDKAHPMLADALKLKDVKVIERSLKRVELTTNVDPKATLPLMEMAKELGYISSVPAVDDLFDLRFVKEAATP